MTSATLEIVSRAKPGREVEYLRWYQDIHIGEILALPGFISGAIRRRLGPDGKATGEFVAHYQIEGDDPVSLTQGMFATAPTMRLNDSIDVASVSYSFLVEVV